MSSSSKNFAHPQCHMSLAHRYYYMFKLVSLVFSLLMFFLTSYWTSPEILNLFISVTVSMYCIWCIWSLRKFRIPPWQSVCVLCKMLRIFRAEEPEYCTLVLKRDREMLSEMSSWLALQFELNWFLCLHALRCSHIWSGSYTLLRNHKVMDFWASREAYKVITSFIEKPIWRAP
jgi:hypothetical protein